MVSFAEIVKTLVNFGQSVPFALNEGHLTAVVAR